MSGIKIMLWYRYRLPPPRHVAGGAAGGGDVALPGVVHDHAVGVEAPSQGADCALHALDPAVRKAVGIALVVERDDFVAKYTIEIVTVAAVVDVDVRMRPPGADREAVHAVIGFGPPPVQHGKIQAAVQHHLLSAGTGGFERTARIVQPYVDALH